MHIQDGIMNVVRNVPKDGNVKFLFLFLFVFYSQLLFLNKTNKQTKLTE